jgi:hypothetical protein
LRVLDYRDDSQRAELPPVAGGSESLVDLGALPPGGWSSEVEVRRRWRASLKARAFVVAVFVLGGLAGGVLMRWWDLRQQHQEREAIVSVHVVVAGSMVGSAGGDGGRRVEMEASLAMVNSGPIPVEVSDVHASEGGLTVEMEQTSRVVQPGVLAVPVRVVVDCRAGVPTNPVRVRMTVRPTHGPPRQVSPLMAVGGTHWMYMVDQMCHSLPVR